MARRLQVQKKSRAPTFSPFARLPRELRNKIWFFALPGQRIIELFFDHNPLSTHSTTCSIKVTSPTKRIELVFVNEEAAWETRRYYKPLNFGPGFYCPAEILVDLKIDTIYLSSIEDPVPSTQPSSTRDFALVLPRAMDISQSPQLHLLKTLAIDATVWQHLDLSFLKLCTSLESLTISFQKTSLHDIKPASADETLTFMSDSLYFSEKNGYTRSLFHADRTIWTKALEALNETGLMVLRSFRQEDAIMVGNNVVNDGEEDTFVGKYRGQRFVDESWQRAFVVVPASVCELEVEERVIDLRLMVALYPRERIFEGLKPRFGMA